MSFEYCASTMKLKKKKESFKEFSDGYTSLSQPQASPVIVTEKVVLFTRYYWYPKEQEYLWCKTYRKLPTRYKEIHPSLFEILCLILPFKLSNFKNFILVPINKAVNLNCSPLLGLHKKSRFSQLFEAFLLSCHWSPNRLPLQLPRFNVLLHLLSSFIL